MAAAWPDATWLEEVRLQVRSRGQVVHPGGKVITPEEPEWAISCTVYQWAGNELRTFLNSLTGAAEIVELPTGAPVPADGDWSVTAFSLGTRYLRVSANARTGIAAPKRSDMVRIGTSTDNRLYEVAEVGSGTPFTLDLNPRVLPVSGANIMRAGKTVSVRMANPGGTVWGRYSFRLQREFGTTIEWVEVVDG